MWDDEPNPLERAIDNAREVGTHVGHAEAASDSAEDAADAAKDTLAEIKDVVEEVQHIPTLEEIHDTAREGARKGAHEALGDWETRQNERLAGLERRLDELLTGDVVKVRDKEVAADPDGAVAVAEEGQEVVANGADTALDVVEPPPEVKPTVKRGRYYRI